MTCDHADPCKEAKSPDLLGPPLDYMVSHWVFEAKKTSEYDLCCFYQVGLSGDLLEFPSPHKPTTCEQVSSLLLKARVLGQPNLIVVHSQDVVTAVCLLQELHIENSLFHLPVETKAEAGSKLIQKLSFCPFCQYSGSNNPSYMNHIVCRHYNTNYGCSKCLNEVYITRHLLSKFMKTCKGLPKRAADTGTVENKDGTVASSSRNGVAVGSKKDGATTPAGKKKKHRSKDLPPDSQPPPQSSQTSLQASPCHSKHTKKKSVATPQKSGSSSQISSQEEKCSSSHKHHSKDKSSKDKHHCKDKHHGKDKHCGKDKSSKKKK